MYDLSLFVKQKFPEATDEETALWVMVLNAMGNPHKDGDTVAIPNALLIHCGFAPATVKRFIARNNLGVFDSRYQFMENGKGFAQKFYPSRRLRKMTARLNKWLKQNQIMRFVKNQRFGRRTRLVPHTEKPIVHKTEVGINQETIEKFRLYLQNTCDKPKDWRERRIKECNFVLDLAEDGIVTTYYYYNRTNRFTAIGTSLQTISKEVRNAALTGYYEYDLVACQQQIIAQNFDCPTVKAYADNRTEWRGTFAERFGESVKNVKNAITAMCYGGGIKEETTSISEMLINYDGFRRDSDVVEMDRELDEAAVEMAENGTWYSATRNIRTNLAYFGQREESRILHALMKHTDPKLLVHDSIILDQDLPVEWLERVIYEETGYVMRIEKKRVDITPEFV